MTVDTLADALNVRESTLRELNPALTDIVWSGDKYVPQGFELRVPRDTAAVAEALLGAIDADKLFAAQRRRPRAPRAPRRHVVADRGRVPREPGRADARQRHDEPQRDPRRPARPLAGRRRNRPARCDAGARRAGTRCAGRRTPALAATSAEGVYVVRRGDSIERIATRLGVDAQALIAANDIRNRNVIQVGQQLIIPNARRAPSWRSRP